jgi:2-desacetyl-2-hydroxyethyl bacteriochlorophyllide A dehydrogenase
VVIDAPHALRVEEAELPPVPAAGRARVRSLAIGICGSDVHVYGGHHPFVTYPVFPGHELVGEVEAVGTGVDPAWVGRRVVLEPGLACGACRMCRRGDVHLCASLRVMGFQAPGGMADAFDVDLDRLHALPDAVATEHGALVEPLAVATHAVRLAGDVAGRDVLVLGAGTIGVVCALVARADGARVLVVDPSRERREAAAAGFGLELAAEAPVDAADVVFECAGAEAALRAGIEALRKGGTLMVVGVHGQDARVQAGWIQDRELRLQGTLMYQRPDVVRAIDLIATGALDVSAMVGARYPLDAAPEAFALAAGGGAVLKVLLIP